MQIEALPTLIRAARQAPDLPAPLSLVVTEHRAHVVRGPGCRTHTRAAFPAGVAGPVPFGPRLEALAAYLRYVQPLPVACMDETGLRVAGERRWLHVIGDGILTCHRLGARGDIGKAYIGTAVHDRFISYLSRLLKETAHGLETTGGPVPCESLPPRAQPGPGPVGTAGCLPTLPGRPAGALHPQSGGAGPAHGQAVNEDRRRLPHPGRGRAPRPCAGPGPRPPASGDKPSSTSCGWTPSRPNPSEVANHRSTAPRAVRTGVPEPLPLITLNLKLPGGQDALSSRNAICIEPPRGWPSPESLAHTGRDHSTCGTSTSTARTKVQ